ncbi:hypothetical protein GUITHDRAFT_122256 [Guillardia theta CCMP2712]|uniref:CCHC-type domain-containing protein n=1 Tax=Guillardia theta (strain CCMP2712) TaxID=905079 RepID=L1I5L2_GUITC|nr:hypothetical protein GUITHDRAFT_122256 [Guillardia theta CCMP2712]EKX31553.1 hypothetical protein GUITHDRAFT_122256 [Guillardia theta CCMP2712]|eukprot:XP_005818533.1 hypothetical protein GUITHDRAFT_122256 [Guillardia theta CCMP2712]
MEGLAQQVALLQAQLAAAFQMGALMAPQQPAAPTPAASTGQHPAAAGRSNVSGDTHAQMVAKLRSVPKLDTTRQSPQRNILTWLTAMQYELELHQIPTACWVLCALDFLDQAARDYYVQAYSATELRELPWVKFATQLKSQHMPLGLRAQLVACLDHLRQEPQESMATYYKRTKLLKEQLDLIPGGAAFATDVILRERFATGITNVTTKLLLNAWSASHLQTTGSEPTFLQLATYCVSLDAYAHCTMPDGSVKQLNALTSHVLAGKPNRGKGTPAATGVPGQPRSGGNPQHTPAPRYQSGTGTGRPGRSGRHSSRDQRRDNGRRQERQPSRSPSAERRNVICHACGRSGHYAKDCRRARRSQSPHQARARSPRASSSPAREDEQSPSGEEDEPTTAAVTTRQGKRADAQSRRRHHVQFDGEAHDLLQMNTLTVQTASTLTQAADIDSNLLYLPIQIESERAEQPREILALLDTGAQASILSRAIVDELRLSTHKIATPVKVQFAKDDRSAFFNSFDVTLGLFKCLSKLLGLFSTLHCLNLGVLDLQL